MIALAVALFAVFQPAQAANAVKITINDSDNVVKAGAGYEVHVNVANGALDNSDDFTLEYIVVDSGLFLATPAAPSDGLEESNATNSAERSLVVPASAEGTYTITAGVLDEDGGSGGGPLRLVGTLEVTVGDVGIPIGSVEVVLGRVAPSGGDSPGNFTTATTGVIDSDTKRMRTNIGVTVNVLNSLGNKPNDSEVNQVLLFAPAANSGPASDAGAPGTMTENSSSASTTPAEVGSSENFFVNKGTAGTVDVHAVAIGTGGTATSTILTLTFTGDADAIALSEVSSPLPTTSTDAVEATAEEPEKPASGFATLKITAVDGAGNKANLDATTAEPPVVDGLSFAFKNADGDAVTGKFKTALSQALKAGQDDCDDSATPSTCDTTTVLLTLTTAGAEPGSYMLEATFGANDPVMAEVVVAGKPANIELSSSHETVELGNIVTITATVTDKDGHAVTNENSVTFVAVGSLELTALDSINPGTKHGEAKLRYVVTKGSGTATIIVSDAAEGGTADAVIAISTMPEEPEAMPEEDASVGCLSNLAGFATWACGVESSASEIFGLVSGRGATALHLWNGSAWVRYSVVDGTMVPGSSDFMVAENDILYISN